MKPTVCAYTGVRIPECHCRRCHEAMVARHARGRSDTRAVLAAPAVPSLTGGEPRISHARTGVDLGPGVRIASFTNLDGCRIGAESHIGPFVEIQRGASVGARCTIQSHTFICKGVEIHDEVFVGHGVMFVNDKLPAATTASKALHDGKPGGTVVAKGASVGSGAVVLGGVRVGAGALIGPGAVVTKDVRSGATVAGVPARVVADRC